MNDRISCGGCSATWTAPRACHCGGCHETFSGLTLFDLHRRSSRCLDPAALAAAGDELRLIAGIWRGPERDPATIPEPV